jgi:hypothetical protein
MRNCLLPISLRSAASGTQRSPRLKRLRRLHDPPSWQPSTVSLDVLARASLVERCKTGRTVRCRLRPTPIASAAQWLSRYERFWTEQLDRLVAFVEEERCFPSQASRSSVASKPRGPNLRGVDESGKASPLVRPQADHCRLVFTWAWHSTPERESVVTVTLIRDAAGTLLTLRHEQFFDQKARDGHERGWARDARQAFA